ncbi:MAG: LysR family transcriptional regulator [Chloroflexia bacterium]
MDRPRLGSPTLHQLRVFCTVCRLLSYTRAAEELGCRQPTVSGLVTELERLTGLTLLEQWGKRLALTDEGRELYAHAQKVMKAADDAWQALAALREAVGEHTLPLRVAADTTVGTYVLPRLLGAFQRRYPDVTLNVQVANRAAVRALLLEGDVDLVIAGRPPAIAGLVAEPFLANRMVAIAAPGHPLVGEPRIPLARLGEETFLLREGGSGTLAAVEELFEIAGVPLKPGMVLGHVEAIKQAVAAGLGVSVISEAAVRREVRRGTLAILDVDGFPLGRRWYIARLAGRPITPSAAAFIALLHENREAGG